ncbi:MAG: biotin--[acetyl-CoA-carboxylase] ligase [Bdellovibrionales bacterium]|nr:biotin--[acetyl-CoA-carboxylase] ligase [Bdellovibrionales bacterium]
MSVVASWTRKWAEKRKQPFLFYTQTSSTNDRAKEHLFENKKYKNFLFIAEFQTKGRGRENRKWINSDMMTSWSYSLNQAPQPITVDLMGRALCEALSRSWPGCPFRMKKPNDIYIKNKKVAGLLVEVVNKGSLHQLIIGLGMNVLTHPPSPCFTDLQEYMAKESITEKKWVLFLDEWYKNMSAQVKKCMTV